MIYCIYKTYNKKSPNKFYIGKTIVDRIENGYYKGSGEALKHAFKKYGKRNFETIILEEFENENDAYLAEKEMIQKLNPYYNIAEGGLGGVTLPGNKHTEETIEYLRKINTGENHPNFGKSITDWQKQRLSEENSGSNNGMFNGVSTQKMMDMILKVGSIPRASKELGLPISSLYNRLNRLNVKKIYENKKIVGFEYGDLVC